MLTIARCDQVRRGCGGHLRNAGVSTRDLAVHPASWPGCRLGRSCSSRGGAQAGPGSSRVFFLLRLLSFLFFVQNVAQACDSTTTPHRQSSRRQMHSRCGTASPTHHTVPYHKILECTVCQKNTSPSWHNRPITGIGCNPVVVVASRVANVTPRTVPTILLWILLAETTQA